VRTDKLHKFTTYKLIHRLALELGYRHFDCAEFYGNEAVVGEGLAGFVAAGKRDDLFVVCISLSEWALGVVSDKLHPTCFPRTPER
jgi:aryl-alcohol dehydrogenase-like predicted oxidoreductase